jgi:hypothetical protein
VDIRIEVDAAAITRQLEKAQSRIETATGAALDAVEANVEAKAAEYIAGIYERAIPNGPNGKPRWERSGDLQDGLSHRTTTADARVIEIQGRAATYARPRHDLSRAGGDGITRHNPFFAQAIEATQDENPQIAEEAFGDALGLS